MHAAGPGSAWEQNKKPDHGIASAVIRLLSVRHTAALHRARPPFSTLSMTRMRLPLVLI